MSRGRHHEHAGLPVGLNERVSIQSAEQFDGNLSLCRFLDELRLMLAFASKSHSQREPVAEHFEGLQKMENAFSIDQSPREQEIKLLSPLARMPSRDPKAPRRLGWAQRTLFSWQQLLKSAFCKAADSHMQRGSRSQDRSNLRPQPTVIFTHKQIGRLVDRRIALP